MSQATNWSNDEVHLNQRILDLVFACRNYEDLCRSFVHSEATDRCIQGAHLFSVNKNADLDLAASYGRVNNLIEDRVDGWGAHPCAEAIRQMKPVFRTASKNPILAVPLSKDNYPNGCLVLLLDPDRETSPLPMSLFATLSKVGGFFVSTRSPSMLRLNGGAFAEAGQLTPRQLEVLELMSQKQTNGQIARKLLVSESTVRQETIRIFRNLNATGRIDAVEKAASAGLLD